jgi:hypothetical protein
LACVISQTTHPRPDAAFGADKFDSIVKEQRRPGTVSTLQGVNAWDAHNGGPPGSGPGTQSPLSRTFAHFVSRSRNIYTIIYPAFASLYLVGQSCSAAINPRSGPAIAGAEHRRLDYPKLRHKICPQKFFWNKSRNYFSYHATASRSVRWRIVEM